MTCQRCEREGHDFTTCIWSIADLEKAKNAAYAERNKCVVALARLAIAHGYKAGVGQHVGEDWESDWRNIVFIDLPEGQVSWHFHDSELSLLEGLPKYEGVWDGHSADEKYRRVLSFPPCGGNRCFRAANGREWIHSSKSYGTCAIGGT